MKKEKTIRKLLLTASCVCFIISALLIAWSFISKINFLEEKYDEYIRWLSDLENNIASIDNLWLLLLAVMLLYFVKTSIPIYPVSIICVATAMVFPLPAAFAINVAGMILLFSVNYIVGTNPNGRGTLKFVRKSNIATHIIVNEGKGNPWVLFIFRLMPFLPVNPVSQLYGSMAFPFWKYIIISLIGYLPRMASYIIIGRNVANPFSLRFSIPLMLMCILSGLILLVMYAAWDTIDKIIEHK